MSQLAVGRVGLQDETVHLPFVGSKSSESDVAHTKWPNGPLNHANRRMAPQTQ
jgi:hypothetical protein